MDLSNFAGEVEDAADCYSWAPSRLREWLWLREKPTLFDRGLCQLLDADLDAALAEIESSSSGDCQIIAEAIHLVVEGATPNTIRRRLRDAAAVEADRRPQPA